MNVTSLRNILAATAFLTTLAVGPSESKAIFHWCRSCAAPAPPPPVYAPPPPAVSYYAPCAPPTVVNYVPQTYYRPVTVNTPVTTYQPVTQCGLCGPTTTMRPVTTMVPQTQYVPYTSYRLMYSPAYVAPAVPAAPAVVNYAPAPAPVMPAAPAPACCGGAAPTTAASPIITAPGPMMNGTTTIAPAPASPQPTPAPAPEQHLNGSGSNGGEAPPYDPNRPAAPQIRLSIPPYNGNPGPVVPRQTTDADNHTAARPSTPNVINAAYAQGSTSATADAWRASSR